MSLRPTSRCAVAAPLSLFGVVLGLCLSTLAQDESPPNMGSVESAGGAIAAGAGPIEAPMEAPPSDAGSPGTNAAAPASPPDASASTPQNDVPAAAEAALSPAPESSRRPSSVIELLAPEDDPIPDYHISQVSVEGAVHDDRADLSVTVRVEVHRDAVWLDVPLRLSQAHIYRVESSGPGDDAPAAPAMQEEGLSWRLRGQGVHELTFQLGVPVRMTAAGRRLQLSLPMMPPLFEARAKLTLPGADLVVRSQNRDAALQTIAEGDHTLVTGGVPGGRLDLQWSEAASAPVVESRVRTQFTLTRVDAEWRLQGQQSLQRSTRGRAELLAKIPAAFRVDDLAGPHIAGWGAAADRPGWVRIQLGDDASERTDLRWQLSAPFSDAGGIVSLDGLELENVRIQEGRLRVSAVPGFRLLPIDSQVKGLDRRDDALTSPDGRPAALTYEFGAVPWSVVLDVKQLEPKFACTTDLELSLSEQQALLTVQFTVRVETGEVRTISALLAPLLEQGWAPVTAPLAGGPWTAGVEWRADRAIIPLVLDDDGLGAATIQLRRTVDGASFEAALAPPDASATWSQSGLLSVRTTDAFRLEVDGAERIEPALARAEASSPSPGPAEAPPRPTPAPGEHHLRATYRLPAGGQAVSVRGFVEPRTIRASSVATVHEVRPGRILLSQSIRTMTEFGRVAAFHLKPPESLPMPRGAEAAALSVSVDGAPVTNLERDGEWLRVPLPAPRIGPVELVIQYAAPRPESATAPARAPLWSLREAELQTVALRVAPAAGVRLAEGAPGWTPAPTAPDALVWTSSGSQSEVPLQVVASVASSAQRLVIDEAFVRVRLQHNGIQDVYAEYQLSERPETLSVSLPAGAGPPRVLVNGEELPADRLSRSATGVSDWMLALAADAAARPPRVAILYEAPGRSAERSISPLELLTPAFPEGVWLHRTLWEVQLPHDLHLWQSPAGLTRMFVWRRTGMTWGRIATPEAMALRARLVKDEAQALGAAGSFNTYLFQSTGPTPGLHLHAISRSMLVLFGAGLTLLVSFVLWLVPALCNVVTAPAIAFALAVAGLWFSEPIQVLVQPALLGLALAVAATLIDGFFRRRRTVRPCSRPPARPTVLALPEGSRSTIVRSGAGELGAAR